MLKGYPLDALVFYDDTELRSTAVRSVRLETMYACDNYHLTRHARAGNEREVDAVEMLG